MPIEALAQGGHQPPTFRLYTEHVRNHPTMRYNPSTDRALSIDEIAAQCRAAIMKASTPVEAAIAAEPLYDQVLTFARWEDDVLIAA